MKRITFLIAAIMMAIATPVFAVSNGALPLRVIYANTPVSQSSYLQLVAQTVKGIKGVSVLNTGSNPVELAFGAAGSEVAQMLVPATASTGQNAVPVYYPLAGGYGQRLSVISLPNLVSSGQINSAGELEVNLFYN